jgi:hypothetical protein
MRYIVTERQYRVITEQNMSGWSRGLTSKQTSDTVKGWNDAYSNHTFLSILQIGTAFIPLIGTFLSAGIGLADAAKYLEEGDEKTAGLIALFSIIPGIGGLAAKLGLGPVSVKLMSSIAKKISSGTKLTAGELQIANNVTKNGKLIQSEVQKFAKNIGVKQTAGKQVLKKGLTKVGKFLGKQVAPYVATGYVYDKVYDATSGKKVTPTQGDITKINTKTISQANLQASKELQF